LTFYQEKGLVEQEYLIHGWNEKDAERTLYQMTLGYSAYGVTVAVVYIIWPGVAG
jgi:hypothetical protein